MLTFRMFSWGPYALHFVVAVVRITIAVMSTRSNKMQLVSKQLYCDVISSFWALDVLVCANQCLSQVDACEGISIERDLSFNTVCKVCLVKAASRPKKHFTAPSNDARIYRPEIDLGKSKPAKNYCYKCGMKIEFFCSN